MIWVADSGSSKTAWRSLPLGSMVFTEGLNPHFASREQMLSAMDALPDEGDVERVYFYGAGCGQERQQKQVAAWLEERFSKAHIEVRGDMLGACRGLLKERAGMVAILGTGSNTCYYDGKKIAANATSLGYVLGDHGSANHVGRLLLSEVLSHVAPKEITNMFYDAYKIDIETILDAIYHRPFANRYVARFAPFVTQHIDNPYCYDLIERAIKGWIRFQVEPLLGTVLWGGNQIAIAGGFAMGVEVVLHRLLTPIGIEVAQVVASPIELIAGYHQEHL